MLSKVLLLTPDTQSPPIYMPFGLKFIVGVFTIISASLTITRRDGFVAELAPIHGLRVALRDYRGSQYASISRLLERGVEFFEPELRIHDLLEREAVSVRHHEIEGLDQVARMVVMNAA